MLPFVADDINPARNNGADAYQGAGAVYICSTLLVDLNHCERGSNRIANDRHLAPLGWDLVRRAPRRLAP